MPRTCESLLCPCPMSGWAGLRWPALLGTQGTTEHSHGKHGLDVMGGGIAPDKTHSEQETLGWVASSQDEQNLSWHLDYVCSCLTFQLNHRFGVQNSLFFHPWGWLKPSFIQHLTVLQRLWCQTAGCEFPAHLFLAEWPTTSNLTSPSLSLWPVKWSQNSSCFKELSSSWGHRYEMLNQITQNKQSLNIRYSHYYC